MRLFLLIALPAVLIRAAPSVATETPVASLDVVEMVVAAGLDREARAPVDVAESFPAGTERVWCFTRIQGATAPLEVVHAWYHEGETRARVVLPVRSRDWRTWSSKLMLPGWTGRWEVKVLDPDGLVLATTTFTIVPAQPDGEEPR